MSRRTLERVSAAIDRSTPGPHEGTPVRVLFIVAKYPPPVVGGLERQARELSIALARLGVGVMVISQRLEPSQPRREMLDGITVFRVSTNLSSQWRPVQLTLGVVRVMLRERRNFDVVHLHSVSRLGTAAIALAKLLGKPTLAKLPGVGGSGIPGQIDRSFGRMWLGIFRRADAVVAMSAQSVEELRQVGFPQQRIFQVSNGVSVERFGAGEVTVRARGRLRVVYVGRLLESKGVLDLMTAWATVVKSHNVDAVLDIFGSGPDEPRMRQRVSELDIEHSVEFRGWADDLAPILRDGDVFVLPSYGEGNSNAVLEAMASGLPVVSTRVGGTPSLVGTEGAPWLVEPGDTDGLARRIASLVLDSEMRTRLGRAMRARAREHFDIGKVAERYLRAYHHLIRGEPDHVAHLADEPIQV